MTSSLEYSIAKYLIPLMKQAGLVVAIATHQLKKDSNLTPIVLKPRGKNEFSLDFLVDSNDIVNTRKDLELNPNKLMHQIFVSDSHAYLPSGKIRAIRLEIRNYGVLPFELTLVVPYVFQPQFKIFSAIRYSHTILHEEQFDYAMEQFYISAFEFIDPLTKKSLWEQYFSEREYHFLPDGCTSTVLHETEECFGKAIPSHLVKKISVHSVNQYTNPFKDVVLEKELKKLPYQYRNYLQVLPPNWLKEDYLYHQIKQIPHLYRNGYVVWGAVIRINTQMFEPQGDNGVGEVLFDPTGRMHPEELQEIAQKLHKLKETVPREKDQYDYVQVTKNEKRRLVNYDCPESICSVGLKICSVWFWRPHLPNGMLSMSYLPFIIQNKTNVNEAMVLPAWFWLASFRRRWLMQSKKKFGLDYDLTPSIFKSLEHTKSIVPGAHPAQLKPLLSEIFHDEMPIEENGDVKVKVNRPSLEIKEHKVKKRRLLKKRKMSQQDWMKWLTRAVVFVLVVKILFELT